MMNGREFLEVAADLSSGEREGDWRSAISRAYYGCFHVARQLLQECGFQVPRGDQAHAYLWRRLSNSGHTDIVAAGRQLNQLRNDRNWADYDLQLPLNQVTGHDRVLLAEKIADLLEAVATMPTVRATITDVMKTYERDVLHEATWTPT
jgi:uncharacterized protein (UPF0332 family)